MKQFNITPAMGKRLIGMGMANLPVIKNVLKNGTLVIIAGTTNGYVVEEILKILKIDFDRKGFRRGITINKNIKPKSFEFLGDIIIIKGKLVTGKTIFDISNELTKDDVILKGANAFDKNNQVAIQIAHPEGGTIHESLKAVYGRRTKIIYPVGMEKRVFGNLKELADIVNSSESSGPRLYLPPGQIFTELNALNLLTGTTSQVIAAGGVYGAEGSIWVASNGTLKQEKKVEEIMNSIINEDFCEV